MGATRDGRGLAQTRGPGSKESGEESRSRGEREREQQAGAYACPISTERIDNALRTSSLKNSTASSSRCMPST